jgi:hypothetical protein
MKKHNAVAVFAVFALVAMASASSYIVRYLTPGGTNTVVTISPGNQHLQPVEISTHIAGSGTVTNTPTATFKGRAGIPFKCDTITASIRAADITQKLNSGTNSYSPAVLAPGDQWILTNTGSAVGSNVHYRIVFKVLD